MSEKVAASRTASALDGAYGLRMAGDRAQALRWAAALLTAAPDSLGAGLLLARLLLDHGAQIFREPVNAVLAIAGLGRFSQAGKIPEDQAVSIR